MGPRQLHLRMGYPWTAMRERYATNAVLQGVKRVHGAGPTARKMPITTAVLQAMLPHLNFREINDRCLWAMWLVMFFCLLRKSNVTANKPGKNPTQLSPNIIRSDVQITAAGIRLTVRKTKTIQFGQRALGMWVPNARGATPLCPTLALLSYLSATAALPATAPLFALPGRDPATGQLRWGPVNYNWMLQRLKAVLASANQDPQLFAAHSFRRGGATYAYMQGMSDLEIMRLGDWRSPVWHDYVEVQDAQRQAASQRLATALVARLDAGPHPVPPSGHVPR